MVGIILDIEVSNHLDKDCQGDFTKLNLGLVGIKILGKEEFHYFNEGNIDSLKVILSSAEIIIGYNLIGYNGFDYKVLNNYGIDTKNLIKKTYDIMSLLIKTFGSYKGFGLENIAQHTFGISKKRNNTPNYILIQNKQIDKIKENLRCELEIIERLFSTIMDGGILKFRTSNGLIDEHILNPTLNNGKIVDEIIEPYDLLGIRLQIKEKTNEEISCQKCLQKWKVKSISYYGDSIAEKIFCPICDQFLIEVNSNLLGSEIIIENKDTLPLVFLQEKFRKIGISLEEVQITDGEEFIEIEGIYTIAKILPRDVYIIEKESEMPVLVEINEVFKRFNLKDGNTIHAIIVSKVDENKITSIWNFKEIRRL